MIYCGHCQLLGGRDIVNTLALQGKFTTVLSVDNYNYIQNYQHRLVRLHYPLHNCGNKTGSAFYFGSVSSVNRRNYFSEPNLWTSVTTSGLFSVTYNGLVEFIQ